MPHSPVFIRCPAYSPIWVELIEKSYSARTRAILIDLKYQALRVGVRDPVLKLVDPGPGAANIRGKST